MTRKTLILIAAAGSFLALAGALLSQYVLGLYPCPLCLWQRWPHVAALFVALAALTLRGPLARGPWLPLAGVAAALATAGIGGFHTGVEQGWWEGLASCTAGPGITGLSIADLLDPTAAVPAAPRCDEVTAAFLGLSMASWNMLVSLALAALWLAAARRPR